MIRESVRDLIDLCNYATAKDRGSHEAGGVPRESFRKLRWKQRREEERARLTVASSVQESAAELVPQHEPQANPDAPSGLTDPLPSPPAISAHCSDEDADVHPLLRFDPFMNEFVVSEVDARNIRLLPSKASDPLEVLSIPSRREGYSLTMCSVESTSMLVVFGGRQLRDLTNLLPVASTELDPLKLERVRYAFSNGVYSYELQSATWSLRQCAGRLPKERSDHSAVFVDPHCLIVVGGRGCSGLMFNDCFVLSLRDWHWTELDTRTRPSPRYWHGCCTAGEDLFIFGGKSEVEIYGDLQRLNISRAIDVLLKKQQQPQDADGGELTPRPPPDTVRLPLSWAATHTVGKQPSARFGLRMVSIDHDRIALVGGWRRPRQHAARRHRPQHRDTARVLDVHVLDTTTLVWTKPRFSSHVCRLSAPPERFHFECFYTHRSLVVFGGFTYATNGETESYSVREDDRHVIYKLDLHRMIWRRQVVTDPADAALLATAFPCFSSNTLANHGDDTGPHTAIHCVASSEQLPLALTAMELQRRHHQRRLTTGDESA